MADEQAGEKKQLYSLRVQPKRQNEAVEDTEEEKLKMKKLKKQESYERWKKKMKKNPVELAKFKHEDAAKHRQSRRDMSDEERERYNAKARERMKKYRERKRLSNENETKTKTRNQIQKQRTYWRDKKREQRSRMSEEQKLIYREKRRLKYHSDKVKKKLFDCEPTDTSKRIRVPQESQEYAIHVKKLVKNCTPRKQKALKKQGVNLMTPKTVNKNATNAKIVASIKTELKKLKQSQSARERQLYYSTVRSIVGKHYVENNIRQALDLKMNHWRKLSYLQEEPIPAETPVSDETKENIKTFYLTDSEYLSGRRTATKKVMTDTLKNSHSTFLSRNHGTKVSLSTFIKRRPKQVLTMDKMKFQGCLCEYCTNIEFKLEALNKYCNETDLKELKLENKFRCLKKTVCPTNENEKEIFKDTECIERTCENCGEHSIALHFHPLTEKMGDKILKWKRWELCSLNNKKRQMLVEKEGPVLKLLKELTEELKPFAKHIFTALWQRGQYRHLISNIPRNYAILLMDFSENYRCVNQDEIQAAYYQYNQATVFPVIAHYRCEKCNDGIVEESACFISPDMKHDNAAANEYIRVMNQHLKETITITHEIQYSDGCAGQFKSKKPFQHMSEEADHIVEKSYFGSRHGKSLCDSLGGLVKNQAAKHVRSRKGTIPDAKALYEFCVKNLTIDNDSDEKGSCSHKKRTFFYVDNIQRESKSEDELLSVKGTQSFHNVKAVSPGIIKMRKLACFCDNCLTSDGSRCKNIDTVGGWETKLIPRKKSLGKSRRKEESTVAKKKAKSDGSKKNQRKGKWKKGKGKKKEPPNEPKCPGKKAVSRMKAQTELPKPEPPSDQKSAKTESETNVQRKTQREQKVIDKDSRLEKVQQNPPREQELIDKDTLKMKVQPEEPSEHELASKDTYSQILSHCSTYSEIRSAVKSLELDSIRIPETRTILNSNKAVDTNSLPLVPEDIPLQPLSKLMPVVIYGDGNCLPRTASFLISGHEEHYEEMRRRIVIELTKNEKLYLNNETMRKGKHINGDENVVKRFAMYSSCFMGERLNSNTIRSIYRREVVEVMKSGEWMGMWQVASLANIFNRPVVSVCPAFGTRNTRNDMHRVFYPFNGVKEEEPVFIMWTSLNGKGAEKDFVLNHFTALIPFEVAQTDDESDNSFSNGLNISELLDQMMADEMDPILDTALEATVHESSDNLTSCGDGVTCVDDIPLTSGPTLETTVHESSDNLTCCDDGDTCADDIPLTSGPTLETTVHESSDKLISCDDGVTCVDDIPLTSGPTLETTVHESSDNLTSCGDGVTCVDDIPPTSGPTLEATVHESSDNLTSCGDGVTCVDDIPPTCGPTLEATVHESSDNLTSCDDGITSVDDIPLTSGPTLETTVHESSDNLTSCDDGITSVDDIPLTSGPTLETTVHESSDNLTSCGDGVTCVDDIPPTSGPTLEATVHESSDNLTSCGDGDTCVDDIPPTSGPTLEATVHESSDNLTSCDDGVTCVDDIPPTSGPSLEATVYESSDNLTSCDDGVTCVDDIPPTSGPTLETTVHESSDNLTSCGDGVTCVDDIPPTCGPTLEATVHESSDNLTCCDDGVTCVDDTPLTSGPTLEATVHESSDNLTSCDDGDTCVGDIPLTSGPTLEATVHESSDNLTSCGDGVTCVDDIPLASGPTLEATVHESSDNLTCCDDGDTCVDDIPPTSGPTLEATVHESSDNLTSCDDGVTCVDDIPPTCGPTLKATVHEPTGDLQKDVEMHKEPATFTRFNEGTHISIKHGSKVLTAVVVQDPNNGESNATEGLWVKFYKRAPRNRWSLEEKQFFVLYTDIIAKVEAPMLIPTGRRLFYAF